MKGEAGKIGFSAIVLLLPPAITFGLGTWQLQRRQWKIQLLELRQQRLTQEPEPIASVLSSSSLSSSSLTSSLSETVSGNDRNSGEGEDCSLLEYRRVVCKGHFDENRSLYVGPRGKSVHGVTEKGFYMITPLLPEESGEQPAVLINRGWVPGTWRETQNLSAKDPSNNNVLAPKSPSTSVKSEALESPPPSYKGRRWWWPWNTSDEKETVEKAPKVDDPPPDCVTGVIRCSEIPNSFVPSNRPETGEWFFIDVSKMAQSCGLPEDTPLVDLVKGESNENFQKGNNYPQFPAPKDVSELLQQKVMPHDHLLYAATWYTLSVATCFLAFKALRKNPVRKGRIVPSQEKPP